MKIHSDHHARKRPVNLTLNEDVVLRARSLTNNLSGVVELLLKEFIERTQQERIAEAKSIEATVAAWNAFEDIVGSFADEYSPL